MADLQALSQQVDLQQGPWRKLVEPFGEGIQVGHDGAAVQATYRQGAEHSAAVSPNPVGRHAQPREKARLRAEYFMRRSPGGVAALLRAQSIVCSK
jgi:hypothetical protein